MIQPIETPTPMPTFALVLSSESDPEVGPGGGVEEDAGAAVPPCSITVSYAKV
jgi:hypothetical protein